MGGDGKVVQSAEMRGKRRPLTKENTPNGGPGRRTLTNQNSGKTIELGAHTFEVGS